MTWVKKSSCYTTRRRIGLHKNDFLFLGGHISRNCVAERIVFWKANKDILYRLGLKSTVCCLLLYVFKSQTCSNDRGVFCLRRSPDHVQCNCCCSCCNLRKLSEWQHPSNRVFCWRLKTPGEDRKPVPVSGNRRAQKLLKNIQCTNTTRRVQ